MSDMIRMSIDVPADLHRFIKMTAASRHQTIREFIIGRIAQDAKKAISAARKPAKERKFNRLTRETLEKSLRGEDVFTYASYDDFLREMGRK